MRTPLIAGNWKQHKTEAEAIRLVRALMRRLPDLRGVEVLVCPPFTSLSQLHKLLVSSPILLGGQNISEHPGGAFTGEITAEMVAEFCSHVIVGHSERRSLFGETDQIVSRKLRAALREGLIPILCVGESREQREQGLAAEVVSRQLRDGLKGVYIEEGRQLVVAYEPIWAIGSGKSATPGDAQQVNGGVIRPVLANLLGEENAKVIKILYGGSVNPGNAGSFFHQEDVDGALVGGASLEAESFLEIIDRAK